MKYREQLLQEINQVESQLKKLEKLERSKMKERNQLNKEILKILLKKQKAEMDLKKKVGNSTEFSKHDNLIQVTNPERSQKSSQKTLHRACLYARNLMLGLRTVTGS